tara:strand:+ start:871 stop:1449 length:579 start_codon:yes stop_codon:yes gene_type:complete
MAKKQRAGKKGGGELKGDDVERMFDSDQLNELFCPDALKECQKERDACHQRLEGNLQTRAMDSGDRIIERLIQADKEKKARAMRAAAISKAKDEEEMAELRLRLSKLGKGRGIKKHRSKKKKHHSKKKKHHSKKKKHRGGYRSHSKRSRSKRSRSKRSHSKSRSKPSSIRTRTRTRTHPLKTTRKKRFVGGK